MKALLLALLVAALLCVPRVSECLQASSGDFAPYRKLLTAQGVPVETSINQILKKPESAKQKASDLNNEREASDLSNAQFNDDLQDVEKQDNLPDATNAQINTALDLDSGCNDCFDEP